MKLIKLGAIDSTNEFLKGLSSKQSVENFTVVTAENQTKLDRPFEPLLQKNHMLELTARTK